jgi:hypothetical protein
MQNMSHEERVEFIAEVVAEIALTKSSTKFWLAATGKALNAAGKGVRKIAQVVEAEAGKPKAVAVTPEGMMLDAAKVVETEVNPLTEAAKLQEGAAVEGRAAAQGAQAAEEAEAVAARSYRELEMSLSSLQNSEDLKELEETVSQLMNHAKRSEQGLLKNAEMSVSEYFELEQEAKALYDEFRNTSADLSKISKNTGISESIISQIKKHLFFIRHELEQGTMQFDPDIDIARAWKRLIHGDFFQSDLQLLLHEFTEITIIKEIMKGEEVNARLIHDLANKIHNWQDIL